MKTVPCPTLSAYDMLIDIGIMIKYQRISSMPEDGQQGTIIEQFIQLVVIIAAAFSYQTREKLNLSNQYTLALLFSVVVHDVVATAAAAAAAAAATAAGCF
ncbi:hypothetical protein T07_15158 [Trichinella nelsoni]|uniref:Uncharacterized protein n=1 Tax=Trichinella nelsoni TaxID=6336 RepID=A0A0V0SHK0_9BILA|nr:hypothetical protein T07_15158 [Trichinella nelsoni]